LTENDVSQLRSSTVAVHSVTVLRRRWFQSSRADCATCNIGQTAEFFLSRTSGSPLLS